MANLYLIKLRKSKRETHSHDYYDSAVVVAEDYQQAKMIHPKGVDVEDLVSFGDKDWTDDDWRDNLSDIEVQFLGKASENYLYFDSGEVVCASFNAG